MVKELVISGIQKQDRLISELIQELEHTPELSLDECHFVESRSREIAKNLRKLRLIKDRYVDYLESLVNLG